jgi:hypothetical protein
MSKKITTDDFIKMSIELFTDKYNYSKTNYVKDNIKDNFCKNNNIKLIRIPYYEFDNIEKILNYSL